MAFKDRGPTNHTSSETSGFGSPALEKMTNMVTSLVLGKPTLRKEREMVQDSSSNVGKISLERIRSRLRPFQMEEPDHTNYTMLHFDDDDKIAKSNAPAHQAEPLSILLYAENKQPKVRIHDEVKAVVLPIDKSNGGIDFSQLPGRYRIFSLAAEKSLAESIDKPLGFKHIDGAQHISPVPPNKHLISDLTQVIDLPPNLILRNREIATFHSIIDKARKEGALTETKLDSQDVQEHKLASSVPNAQKSPHLEV